MKTFVTVLLCLCAFSGSLFAADARLGINLEASRDYQPNRMFADAMKSSRPWGSVATPWDMAAPIDANGWPTADAALVVMTGAQYHDIGGTYALSFTGQATVRGVASIITIQHQLYDAASNTTTADVVVDPQNVQIMLSFTGTQGGVRNVKLMRPGYTTETFTREFLALIQPFSMLRFMWTTETIDSNVVEWSDRTLPTHASQNRQIGGQWAGTAWEYVAELANLTGKEIWVNVPDQASDDYIRQLAVFLMTHVRADIPIYVEYSNEVWNYTYRQTQRNLAAAQAEVAAGNSPLNFDGQSNPGYLAWRRVGKKTKEISDIFRSVFGDAQMMSRVRPVLAMQHDGPMTIRQPLEFLEAVYGPPSNYLYAISSAPYFGPDLATRQRTDLTVDEIISAMIAALPREINMAIGYVTWARHYRLQYVAYEGGPFLDGAASLAAKIASSRDPRMQDLVVSFLNQFAQCGGDAMAYYTSIAADGQYGIFALTDNVHNLNTPKFAAVRQWLNAPAPALTAGVALPGSVAAGQFDLQSGFTPAGQASVQVPVNTWFNYLVRVPVTGTYSLVPNIATMGDGAQLQLLVDSIPINTWTAPNTRGLGNWTDLPAANVNLQAGQHVIRLSGVTGSINVRMINASAVNLPLTFTSAPSVVPNPPTAGSSATFTAAATGNGVTLAWNFGDGSPAITANAPTHTFAAAGSYSVTVTASDLVGNSLSNSLTINVNAAPMPPPPPLPPFTPPATPMPTPINGAGNGAGSDGGTAGSDPGIAAGNGGSDGSSGGTALPLTITALLGIANPASSGHDQCTVAGTLPALPDGFVAAGTVVNVTVGAATAQFALDKTGKGKSSSGSLLLKLPRKHAALSAATFKLMLKNATLTLLGEVPATLDLQLALGAASYASSVHVTATRSGNSVKIRK